MENYIKRVNITGLFDVNNNYNIDFIDGCNCIFGDNGTGKTSIINLIVSSITADIEKINKIPFSSITLQLAKKKQVRPKKFLTVSKFHHVAENRILDVIIQYEFHQDGRTFELIAPRLNESFEDIKRAQFEKISAIKELINKEIKLTHVPLLRVHEAEIFGSEHDEYLHMALRRRQFSQKQISEIMDPSLRVISSIQYQFIDEFNERRKQITSSLEILKSKIIEKVMIDSKLVKETANAFKHISTAITSPVKEIDSAVYFKKLTEANIYVPETKVYEHFKVWKDLTAKCKNEWLEYQQAERNGADTDKLSKARKAFDATYFSLFSITHFYDRFDSIVTDVEKMQNEKSAILKIFTDYEEEINTYLSGNKVFKINEDGQFKISSGKRDIELADLSSGEKHIITILGRAALSKNKGSIFVADEPELSLHLDWQRKILPSIQRLSPLSQIIVATHSPSINAKGASSIDLSECR